MAPNATVTMPLKQIRIVFRRRPRRHGRQGRDRRGPSAATTLSPVTVKEKALVAAVEGDAPAGSYTVAWQSAGGDGHIQKGEFAFTLAK